MSKLKGKARSKARKNKGRQSKLSRESYKRGLLSSILKYDAPFLADECQTVPENTDVSKDISDMKKVLGCTENGVGLAASQIGICKKIIVFRKDSNSSKMTVMINPEIVSHGMDKKYGIEGCLSYPKTFAPVERFTSIEVEYFDENWKKCTKEYEEGEIEGVVVQHEIEHLLFGHCQIHDWWKNPEGKQQELKDKFEPKSSSNTVVESDDLKSERAAEVTKEALSENNFVVEDIEELAESIDSGQEITVEKVESKDK